MTLFDIDLTKYLPILGPPSDHPISSMGAVWAVNISLAALTVAGICYLIAVAAKTRSMMPIWLIVSGVMCFFFEALGDNIYAIWYSPETPWIALEMLHRHVPIWILFVWVGAFPPACYIAYRLAATRAPLAKIVLVGVAIGLFEISFEMAMCNVGAMQYFGNYAKVFGVPFETIVQNSFMLLPIGCALAHASTRFRGIGLLLIPSIPVSAFAGWAMSTSLPNYLLAGHGHLPMAWRWLIAIGCAAASVVTAIRIYKRSINKASAVETREGIGAADKAQVRTSIDDIDDPGRRARAAAAAN